MPGCSATFCFQNVIIFEIISAQFLIFLAISWMHSKIVPLLRGCLCHTLLLEIWYSENLKMLIHYLIVHSTYPCRSLKHNVLIKFDQ